jgi:hypothetical protein
MHESGIVQVYRRWQRRSNHMLRRPAAEKRQGTKSRRWVVRRRYRGRYGDLAAGSGAQVMKRGGGRPILPRRVGVTLRQAHIAARSTHDCAPPGRHWTGADRRWIDGRDDWRRGLPGPKCILRVGPLGGGVCHPSRLAVVHLNLKLSRFSWSTDRQPISFMSRSISARRFSSALSTPA